MSERKLTAAGVLAAAVASGVIVAHAGLVGSGQWQADEYFNFALLRQLGRAFLFDRVLHWSPRPFSEAGLYLYFRLVERLHRPLIGGFLSLCWLVLLAGLLGGWGTRRGMVAVPLGVFAMCLLGHSIDEMFYWPMAAAPYLWCGAGIGFACLRLVRSGPTLTRTDRLLVAAGLLFAAGCAEIGIMFALCLCPLLMLLDFAAPRPHAIAGPAAGSRAAGRWPARGWAVAGWAVPLVPAVMLLWLLTHGRVAHAGDAGQLASPFYHHALASLRVAPGQAGIELAQGGFSMALAGRVLFLGGVALWLARETVGAPALRLMAVATGLTSTIILSVAAASYQFGSQCCERHHSFRQYLVVLLAVVAASLAARWLRPDVRLRAWCGPVLVAGALLVAMSGRVEALAHDYGVAAEAAAARRATWASAAHAGAAMTYLLPPTGRVVGLGHWLGPGQYVAGAKAPWYVTGILMFFGKSTITVPAEMPR